MTTATSTLRFSFTPSSEDCRVPRNMVYEGSLVDKPAGTGVYSSGHRVLEDASPPKRGD